MKKNILGMLACLGLAGVLCGDASAMTALGKDVNDANNVLLAGVSDTFAPLVGVLVKNYDALSQAGVSNFKAIEDIKEYFGEDGKLLGKVFKIKTTGDFRLVESQMNKIVTALSPDAVDGVQLEGDQTTGKPASLFAGVANINDNIGKTLSSDLKIIYGNMLVYKQRYDREAMDEARMKEMFQFWADVVDDSFVDESDHSKGRKNDKYKELAGKEIIYKDKKLSIADHIKNIFAETGYSANTEEEYTKQVNKHIDDLESKYGKDFLSKLIKAKATLASLKSTDPDKLSPLIFKDGDKYRFVNVVPYGDNDILDSRVAAKHGFGVQHRGSATEAGQLQAKFTEDLQNRSLDKLIESMCVNPVAGLAASLPDVGGLLALPVSKTETLGDRIGKKRTVPGNSQYSSIKSEVEALQKSMRGIVRNLDANLHTIGSLHEDVSGLSTAEVEKQAIDLGKLYNLFAGNVIGDDQLKAIEKPKGPDYYLLNKKLSSFVVTFSQNLATVLGDLKGSMELIKTTVNQLKSDHILPDSFTLTPEDLQGSGGAEQIAAVYPVLFKTLVAQKNEIAYAPLLDALEAYENESSYENASKILDKITELNDEYVGLLNYRDYFDKWNKSVGNASSTAESWGLSFRDDYTTLSLADQNKLFEQLGKQPNFKTNNMVPGNKPNTTITLDALKAIMKEVVDHGDSETQGIALQVMAVISSVQQTASSTQPAVTNGSSTSTLSNTLGKKQ